MRVVVTGADGFVGGAIAKRLRQGGLSVTGLVYARPPARGEIHCDLSLADPLREVPAADAVVHAAGVVDMRATPAHMHAVHVNGTEAVAAWARRVGAKHLVHISSVAVYGPLTLGEGRDENTPRYGRLVALPYMRTKALAERVVEAQPVPYTILRPPALVGRGDTVVSQALIKELSNGGVGLWPGGSIERLVSLADVTDLAEIVSIMIERGPLYGALHVTGPALPLGEVIALYARALGLPEPARVRRIPRHLPASAGQLWLALSSLFGQSYAPDRLIRYLGWVPGKSLEGAILSAVSGLHAPERRIS